MERESAYFWRKERGGPLGKVENRLEYLEDRVTTGLPPGMFRHSDAGRRRLYSSGLVGRATVLDAPTGFHGEVGKEALGRFHARVELPGREAYEVKFTQAHWKFELAMLQPGAVVECRVDQRNPKRVLLCAPEPDAPVTRSVDASDLLAGGRRGTGVVRRAEDLDIVAPGTEDPCYILTLEVQAPDEPDPWTVRYAQRIPRGALAAIEPGGELQVAFDAVGDDNAVAVDWGATTGGRFR